MADGSIGVCRPDLSAVSECVCQAPVVCVFDTDGDGSPNGNAFGYLGATFFGMLGGAFVPLAMLPSWARAVAPATPQYWAMRGLRSLILDGKGTSAVGLPVAVLCGYALLFVIIALWRLRFDDAKVGWA